MPGGSRSASRYLLTAPEQERMRQLRSRATNRLNFGVAMLQGVQRSASSVYRRRPSPSQTGRSSALERVKSCRACVLVDRRSIPSGPVRPRHVDLVRRSVADREFMKLEERPREPNVLLDSRSHRAAPGVALTEPARKSLAARARWRAPMPRQYASFQGPVAGLWRYFSGFRFL